MKFSIVVCTYKRYDLVKNCLKHLGQLHVPGDVSYEVIVVENTPPKDRRPLNWVAGFRNARHVNEDVAGLSAARNKGIAEADGDIISFLDDDAEVHRDWLIEISKAFQDNASAAVIGGKVLAKFPDGHKPPWISRKCEEYLSCIDWGDETIPIDPAQKWLVGANISYRASVFREYGTFGTNLGRKGEATLLSNEESEFNGRLPSTASFYCGTATVNHLIPADRLEHDWFRKRAFWQAISDVLAGGVSPSRARELFVEYTKGTLKTPAEYRCVRALFYPCSVADEFTHQLEQIYRQSIALALGTCTWPTTAS